MPKSSAWLAVKNHLPLSPMGAPSSTPRPNVLLASNARPPRCPAGRGRAWAAVNETATAAKAASTILAEVMATNPSARIARRGRSVSQSPCAPPAHGRLDLDVDGGLWLGLGRAPRSTARATATAPAASAPDRRAGRG